jgi:hypothetical protein
MCWCGACDGACYRLCCHEAAARRGAVLGLLSQGIPLCAAVSRMYGVTTVV